MPTPDGSNNAYMARPTPAYNDGKEAMNRALLKERPAELFDRLAKLGTLLISKGNIEWLPAGNHVNKYRLSWKKLAELMEEEGRHVKIAK